MPLFGRRDDGAARSEDEREAARLERERRRAAREGRALPGPAPDEPRFERAQEQLAARDDQPGWDEEQVAAAEQAIWEEHHAPAADGPDWPEQPATEYHHAPVQQVDEHPLPEETAVPADDPAPPVPEPRPPAAPSIEPLHRQEGPVTEPFSPIVPSPDGRDFDEPTVAFSATDDDAPDAAAAGVAQPARRTVQLPRARTEPFDDDGHFDDDAPLGTRRAGRYAPQPGAGGPGHRSMYVRRRRRGRKLLIAFALVALVVVAAAGFAAVKLFQPFHQDGTATVRITIPSGETARDIGDRLQKAGVVDSGAIFAVRARLAGKREELRAGRFTLKRDMSYGAALTALTTAPKSAPVLNVTLPEGPSRREAAPIVKRAGVKGSYLKASAQSKLLDPRAYGAPRRTRSLEGFLFPSTYQLRRSDATAKRLVDAQLKAFKANIAKVGFRRARTKNLSRYDVLIIASMIEREARVPRERRLVAAVIYNRLKQGIPLGIDATTRYADDNWTRPLRKSELERNSPYNTRKNQGLPPTPIGNPGLASIQAAADPASVNYLFYVVRPCGNGAHNFSATNAQFLKDVAAYNRKRDQLKGKDPSICRK